MRSSYIIWNYTSVSKNWNDKTRLAEQMRHSVTSASKYYFKDLTPDSTLDEEQQEQMINENKILKDELNAIEDRKINLKVYTKKRYDIIYRLNNNDKIVPKQTTIEKYQLMKNTAGKWY